MRESDQFQVKIKFFSYTLLQNDFQKLHSWLINYPFIYIYIFLIYYFYKSTLQNPYKKKPLSYPLSLIHFIRIPHKIKGRMCRVDIKALSAPLAHRIPFVDIPPPWTSPSINKIMFGYKLFSFSYGFLVMVLLSSWLI